MHRLLRRCGRLLPVRRLVEDLVVQADGRLPYRQLRLGGLPDAQRLGQAGVAVEQDPVDDGVDVLGLESGAIAISFDTAVSPIRSSSSGLASTLLITTANGVRSLPFLSASAVWRRSFCNALITSSRRASLMEARSPESRSSTHSARNRGMASGSIIRTMPSQCSYWLWRSFSRLSTKVSPAMSSSCMSRDGLTPDPSMKKLNEKALLAPCTVVAAVFSTTPSR